jgi:hypothetical protein
MALQGTPGPSDANLVQFRIERGATALGTDGALGSVEQIVVDRETGELRALIVRSNTGDGEFELPAIHVSRATGDKVYLDIGRTDLAQHPDLAHPYNPQHYAPVNQGNATPEGKATRTAISTEHAVVTGVEENAAELVAPETAADATDVEQATTAPIHSRTDTLADSVTSRESTSASRPGTAETTTPLRGTAVTRPVAPPSDPSDATAQSGPAQPAVQTGSTIGEPSTSAPSQGVSVTPSTTGPTMGALPSTSGMGASSTVPNSDSAPYNMRRDEEPNPERASAPTGLAQALREAGSWPAFAPDDGLAAAKANDEMVEREGLDFARPKDQSVPLTTAEATAMPASSPTAPPLPAGRQLPAPTMTSRLTAQLNDLPLQPSTTTLLAATSLAAGIGMSLLLRQRRSARERARRQARSAKRAAQQTAHNLKDSLRTAGGQAQTATATAAADARAASKQAKRTAKRGARRGRWFRRGLLLGGALSILFAPEPGMELREQIANTIESWRSRIA